MIKKMVILGLICIFLLSGCEQIKELYGIQTTGEEYVPLEDIKIEGDIEVGEEEEAPEEEVVIEEEPGVEEEEVVVEEEPEEVEEEEVVIEEEPEVEEEPDDVEEEEVVIEEEPAQDAKVLIVEETEEVTLRTKAVDPDEDSLSFTYTSPIDEDGLWQTDYGDAGEYTVTVTASDGELSATKNVLIIVNKKEEEPTIDEFSPAEGVLQAKEDSELDFSVKASDLNDDDLTTSWGLDGNEVAMGNSYTYEIGYDAAGDHTVRVVVSDGVAEVSREWDVKVDNVNREPVLESLSNVQVDETDTVVLQPSASDPDGDSLEFSVDSSKFDQEDGTFKWETSYDDSGEYTITLSVSDGEDTVSQEIKVVVGNVNRAPVIEDIILE